MAVFKMYVGAHGTAQQCHESVSSRHRRSIHYLVVVVLVGLLLYVLAIEHVYKLAPCLSDTEQQGLPAYTARSVTWYFLLKLKATKLTVSHCKAW